LKGVGVLEGRDMKTVEKTRKQLMKVTMCNYDAGEVAEGLFAPLLNPTQQII
jgi:hypothetical protein